MASQVFAPADLIRVAFTQTVIPVAESGAARGRGAALKSPRNPNTCLGLFDSSEFGHAGCDEGVRSRISRRGQISNFQFLRQEWKFEI